MSFPAPAVYDRDGHIDEEKGNGMTATYTFDVFSSLDGYGAASAGWSGYWGKQGPELLECRTLDGHILELVYRPSLH